MAIEHYSDVYWFPSGTLAASVSARVFPLNSTSLAQLYTDSTGTTVLPNPINTSPAGILDFWAEAGEYWIHIDSDAFRVTVGVPTVDIGEAVTIAVGTGVVSGGHLTVNALNPKAVDISPVVAYVVDYTTDEAVPSVVRVSQPAKTIPLDAAALTRTVTWWVMDSAGTVTQQAARPDAIQRRTHVVLGGTTYSTATGQITLAQSIQTILGDSHNQLVDLIDALGPFNLNGNVITANGANLSLDRSAGDVFIRSFHHFVGGVTHQDPHVTATAGATLETLTRITRVIPPAPLPLLTTIDPANYDLGGVVTPVGGGALSSTIQRVWLVPTGLPGSQLLVQYGQAVYSSLSAAVDRIGTGTYIPNPITAGNAALLAYIVVTRTATNLQDPAQALIIRASKFPTP